VTAAVAGFAAGVAAALLTVGIAAWSGTFDSSSSTVVREVRSPSSIEPSSGTAPRGAFDPGAIYRARIDGVVTVSAVFGGSEAGGSGFVVSDDGVILTNAHVVTDSAENTVAPENVSQADAVYVRFSDQQQVEADIVGYDLFADVAVLRITGGGVSLTPLPLGDSDGVVVGEPVAAIGSPFFEAGSLSVGVVSAVNRSLESGTGFGIPGAIQTDAAINHGNSGGPLFNADGEVIGINAQIRTTGGGGEGVGFAIPIELAKRSMNQLLEDGRVSYGWLGVQLGTVTPAIADRFGLSVDHGALVEAITSGGPADRAGLEAGSNEARFQDLTIRPDGDVIVAVDGTQVRTSDEFVRLLVDRRAGEVVRLEVVHGGARRTVSVRLGERPL
jgi:S1-C subfamily serine protease